MNIVLHLIALLVILFAGGGCAQLSPASLATHESPSVVVESSNDKLDETDLWIQNYFRSNQIKPQPLSVGMKVEDFVAILGEPTEKYKVQHGYIVRKPEGDHEDWLEWYHNPKHRMHVAPFIRCRIQNGIVTELEANRK